MPFHTFLPKLLNMSLTASVVIFLVLLMRLLLKKAPKVISYALWGIVLIRLLCPVSIGSSLSLFGLLNTPTAESGTITSRIEYVPNDIVHAENPAVTPPDPVTADEIHDALPRGGEQSDPSETLLMIAAPVWLAGVLAMGIHAAASYFRLRRKLITAVPLRDHIYLADGIASPFVMGWIRPKIYLPSSLEEREQSYILMHEQHHIRRGDHIIKALAFAALCIHWFNPLVWIAFIMAGRDMEMSCDEAVIRRAGADIRADYAASLLSLATGRRIIVGMPLAFGEGDPKSRIRNLANRKKPAFWVVPAAVIVCVVLAVCLLTNPKSGEPDLSFLNYKNALSLAADMDEVDTIYYPPADRDGNSEIRPGNVDGRDLAVYLDSVTWQKRNTPKGGLPSPGSIEFCIEDDYRITVYQNPCWIMVRFRDDVRYYKAHDGDYDDAVKLFTPADAVSVVRAEEPTTDAVPVDEQMPAALPADEPTPVEVPELSFAELFAAYAQSRQAEAGLRANRDEALLYCMTQFDAGVLDGLTFKSTGMEMGMYRFWLDSLQGDQLKNDPDTPQQDWEEWSGYVKRLYGLNGYDEAVFTEDMICSRLYVQMLAEDAQEITADAETASVVDGSALSYAKEEPQSAEGSEAAAEAPEPPEQIDPVSEIIHTADTSLEYGDSLWYVTDGCLYCLADGQPKQVFELPLNVDGSPVLHGLSLVNGSVALNYRVGGGFMGQNWLRLFSANGQASAVITDYTSVVFAGDAVVKTTGWASPESNNLRISRDGGATWSELGDPGYAYGWTIIQGDNGYTQSSDSLRIDGGCVYTTAIDASGEDPVCFSVRVDLATGETVVI